MQAQVLAQERVQVLVGGLHLRQAQVLARVLGQALERVLVRLWALQRWHRHNQERP